MRYCNAIQALRGALACLATVLLPAMAAAQGKITVVMPGASETYMIPFFVADDQGLYREAGLSTDFKTVSGNQNALRTILTGAGDVAIVGYPILYEAVINGAKLKGVGGGNQALMDYYLVLAKSKGSTLKDAAGKVLAISTPGSMPQLVPEMMFKEKKIDAAGTRFVAVGSISVRLQSVLAGKVDGTLLDSINMLRGLKSGEIVVVGSTSETLSGPLGYTISVVPDELLKDPARRADLYKFVKASIQGARLATDKPELAAQAMFKRTGGSVDMELLRQTANELAKDKVWGVNGGISRAMHDYTMATYLQYKLISRSVDFADALDDTLAQQAVRELGEIKGRP